MDRLPPWRRVVGWLIVVALGAFIVACEGDEGAWLSFGGQRYVGSVLPLTAGANDLELAGAVEDSNDPIIAEGRVLSLQGVDPSAVLLVPGHSPEDPEYFVFRAEALGSGNIFTLVPALCAYATAEQPECEESAGDPHRHS